MAPGFSVCVFCGARDGQDPAWKAAAFELGEGLARRGWRLVYGAGDAGLMGAVARGAHAQNGARLGVIPEHLVTVERRSALGENLVITPDMHSRKERMYKEADAFVILPGGAGTLDEFFETLTWKQLGRHTKPIFVANLEGYWTPLRDLLAQLVHSGFADASIIEQVSLLPSIPEILTGLEEASA
ncbi:MAG: TIGR00730 family Rossman fold protein [Pseudomonadota bacterium]